jgi:uncharacterized protein (TIGR03083 family)
MTLEESVYVEALQRDSQRLVEAVTDNFGAPVAGCPGWNVRDLVAHTGEVHRFWSQVVERRLQDHRESEPVHVPSDDELTAWFQEGAAHLDRVLSSVDGTIGVWTWSRQKDAAFVKRRMAQETAMHRWDAQSAVGKAEPIEPDLARDGVDELLDVFMPVEETRLTGHGETIHFHQTDGDGEWIVTLGDRITVSRGHAKADSAVRGTGSDLLLMMWRRVPPSQLEVLGQPANLERFLAWIDLN